MSDIEYSVVVMEDAAGRSVLIRSPYFANAEESERWWSDNRERLLNEFKDAN